MSDHYPVGGCILTDKTRCKLPHATCCHEGRTVRWPRCTCPLGCNPPRQSACECPMHAASILAALNDTEKS